LHGPREVDTVGGGYVADEGKHGDAPVLNFGVTKEANGGLVGGAPEFGFSEVDRVIEPNNGVALFGERLEVSLIQSRGGSGVSIISWNFGDPKKVDGEYDERTLVSESAVFWDALATEDTDEAGAVKAAAEPARRERMASFMVLF